MRPAIFRLLSLFFTFLTLNACGGGGNDHPTTQRISPELLVPAYFYPVGSGQTHWNNLINAAKSSKVNVVINVNSGPGTNLDSNYLNTLSSLHTAGGKAFGYISTNYSKRAASDVKTDIDNWLKFYTIEGFFVDEMDNKAASLTYYQDIYSYIKNKNAALKVVGNPGTATLEAYLSQQAADIIVSFESPYSDYTKGQTPAAWASAYSSLQFAHMVYGVSSVTDMQAIINAMPSNHIGMIYVSDDTLSKPYDTLPSYWDQEIQSIQRLQ